MLDYSLTKSRTIQWMIIILVLVALAGAYRYFSVGAATKINSSQNATNNNGLVGQWSFNGADISGTTLNDQSGNSNNGTYNGSISATGGTITTDGDYKVHTFTSSGTFAPSANMDVEYLVVAGGGGGDFMSLGGGGGAGGFRTATGYAVTTGSSITVTVGSGGTAGTGSNGIQGGDSVFGTITSIGGGYGSDSSTAGNGGSGGGGWVGTASGTAGQGHDGDTLGAGGGSTSAASGGVPGAGTASSISSSSVTYAAGGGPSSGTTNPGDGGSGSGTAGQGGIVIIRYRSGSVIGKVGQALSFDGSTSSVSVPDATSLKPTSAISYGGWVYVPSTPGGLKTIIEKGTATTAGYGLYVTSDPKVCFVIKTSGGTETDAGPALTTGAWHHIMVTYDSSTPLLYIDGASQSLASGTGCTASTNTGSITQDTNTLTFGSRQGTSQFFTGKLDEIRVYDRAISAGEVTSLYNFGVGARVNASQNSSNGNGLIGQWSFNGEDVSWSSSTAGTATDTSGNSSTGTITNMSQSTSPVRGKVGQAFNFDGTDDYVTMGTPSVLNLTGVMSISAWIYPTGFGGGSRGRIVDKDSGATTGYIFFVDNANVVNGIAFAVNTTSLSAPVEFFGVASTITLNKWQHVAVTMNASKLVTFYVDGVSVGSATFTNFPGSSANNFVIGGRTTVNDRNFAGTLDEVRVYNRVLSAGEVMSLYNMGVGTKLTP